MGKVRNNIKIKEAVYEIVKKIPKGRVTTYGAIADSLSLSSSLRKITPRYVGYLLHNNPDPVNIPCHRVVDRNGKLAENFAFGRWRGQRKLLLKEGVKFRDLPTGRQGERHVDKKFISSLLSNNF